MIRDILRVVGIGCLLAGGILYFNIDNEIPSDEEALQLQVEVEKLRSELAKTKKLLATAQTISAAEVSAPKAGKSEGKEDDFAESNPPSSDAILNTILTIEAGSNSTVVSANLERLGIIEDAAIFDSYLEVMNLTGRIQIGEHKVNSSMDFQTIAKKITSEKK